MNLLVGPFFQVFYTIKCSNMSISKYISLIKIAFPIIAIYDAVLIFVYLLRPATAVIELINFGQFLSYYGIIVFFLNLALIPVSILAVIFIKKSYPLSAYFAVLSAFHWLSILFASQISPGDPLPTQGVMLLIYILFGTYLVYFHSRKYLIVA